MRGGKRRVSYAVLTGVLAFASIPPVGFAAPTEDAQITSLQKAGDHVKVEWSMVMPDSDVITETGFESGDDIPVLVNGSVNPTGEQSVVFDGESHVLQLLDTVTNRLGNNIVPPATNAVESIAKYSPKSLPDDIVLSLNYRVKVESGSQNNIDMVARSGWFEEGYQAYDNQNQELVYAESVDWNNPPAEFQVKRKSGGTPVISEGRAYTVVTSKDKNYNYGILRYAWSNAKSALVLISTNIPWNDGTLMGSQPTILKDTFNEDDALLTHKNASFTFPSRTPAVGEDWVTLSSNVSIPEMRGYDSLTRGFALRNLWSTDGHLVMDDVKLGYATEAVLYRDGVAVYTGYLSDYEDVDAVDRTAPLVPTDVQVTPSGKQVSLSWTPAVDRGTVYTYQVQGNPRNGSSFLSAEKKIEVDSGVKGYGVVLDNLATTVPSTMNVSSSQTTFTANRPSGDYYVHVVTYDNAGNISDPLHLHVADSSAPTGVVSADTTAWTSNPFEIHVQGYDEDSWVSQIQLPDGSTVNSDTASYLVSENGVYTFTLTDTSGNTGIVSYEVTNFDNDAPDITITSPGAWNLPGSSVDISLSDVGSGVDLTSSRYSVSSNAGTPSAWLPLSTLNESITLPQEGVWYIHVQTQDHLGHTATQVSEAIGVQQLPSAPTLSAGVVTDQSFTLSWEDSATNTDGLTYSLEDVSTGYITPGLTGRSYEVAGLQPGTYVTYRVKAVNHVGESDFSTGLSILTLPAKPDNMEFFWFGHGASDVAVSFDSVPSATGYRVVVQEALSGSVLSDQEVSGTSVPLAGLRGHTAYSVSVWARNESGWGAPLHGSFVSLPDAPGGLGASWVGSDAVTLAWLGDTSLSGYTIKRGGTVTGEVYGSDIEPNTQFTDIDLLPGTDYQYGVLAFNETGSGEESTLSVSTLPAQVTGLHVSDLTSTGAYVVWDQAQGATGYELTVYRSPSDPGEVNGVTGTDYRFDAQVEGSSFRVSVVAVSSGGKGEASETVVRLLPQGMPEVRGVEITETGFVLDIPNLAGADEYRVTLGNAVVTRPSGRYAIEGLKPGTRIDYELSGVNASGSGVSYAGHVITLVGAPETIIQDKLSAREVAYSWEDVIGATGYRVYDRDGHVLYEGVLPTYTGSDLEPGTEYGLRISSRYAGGESTPTEVQFTTLPELDGTSVSVKQVGVHEAVVSWKAAKGATGYRVYEGDRVRWTGAETEGVVQGLPSAASMDNLTVVPYYAQAEGVPAGVPAFVTLPANAFTGVLEPHASKGLTLTLTHQLEHEDFIVMNGRDELYEGKAKRIHLSQLNASLPYSLQVYAVNRLGDRSEGRQVVYTPKTIPANEGGNIGGTVPAEEPVRVPVPAPAPEVTPPIPVTPEGLEETEDAFWDIEDTFSRDAIQYLYDKGLVKGVGAGSFKPAASVTRIEFASMLVRALNVQGYTGMVLSYEDIVRGAWYEQELQRAVGSGIAEGFSRKEFAPQVEITREQAVKMAVSAVWGSQERDSAQLGFSDTSDIAWWSYAYVQRGIEQEIIEGFPDGSFNPKQTMTRAEAALVVYRLLNRE